MTYGPTRSPSPPPGATPLGAGAGSGAAGDRLRLRRAGPLGDGARRDDGWLDDLDEDRPRRRGLVVLAVVPWVVVVALLVLPGRLGQPPEVEPDAPGVSSSEPAADAPGPGAAADTPEAAPSPLPRTDAAGPPRGTAGAAGRGPGSSSVPRDQRAGALATVVARAWLTGVEPVLEVGGARPPDASRYAEHLVVETVVAPDPDAAVVTLLAVILGGDGWLDATVLRLAVPIAFDGAGDARPAGPPWLVPGPSLAAVTPDVDRVEEPDLLLAARDALDAAGFDDAPLLGLGDTGGWPVIAYLDDVATPEVWLQPVDDGFVVAGASSAAPDQETAP